MNDFITEKVKEFEKSFPVPQKESTHYYDTEGKEDCICLSCNTSEYYPKMISFLTKFLQEAISYGESKKGEHGRVMYQNGFREGQESEAIAHQKEDIKVRAFMLDEVENILDDYTSFLCKTGYTDSDVYAEAPTAVDRYLAEKKSLLASLKEKR